MESIKSPQDKKLVCFLPGLGGGGAERQMCKLLELLDQRDIHPTVVTYFHGLEDYPCKAAFKRVKVLYRNKIERNFKILWTLWREKPDILLSFLTDANVMAAIYKRLNPRCRVVVSERTLDKDITKKGFKRAYTLYRHVDAVVPNSKAMGEVIKETYPELAQKVHVIQNYTLLGQPVPFVPTQAPNIVIPARYNPVKNILRFLDAIAIVTHRRPDLQFSCNWYGAGEKGEYFQQCHEKLTQLGLSKKITLHPFAANISEIMRKADVICLPSLTEGFSNTLSEGICLGKPILASNVSDNTLMVVNGKNGFTFEPTDIGEMADKLELMIGSTDKYNQFSTESRRIAEKMFDAQRFLDSYLNLLYEKS